MRNKRKRNVTNLRRIDVNHTHGWQTVIVRKNRPRTKLFSDSLHGGKRAAKKKALAYVKKLIRQYGPSDYRHPDGYFKKPTKRSKTKKTGVSLITKKMNNKNYHYYEASWYIQPYQRETKSFAVNKYGETKALQLALSARKRGERAAKKQRKMLLCLSKHGTPRKTF